MAKIMANTSLRDKLKGYHASLVYDAVKLAASKPIRVSRTPAIVFAPHHDDETFGCGGLIALKRQLGVRVKLVFLTDGARSHDRVRTVEPDLLREIRKEEALKAAAALGVDSGDVIFLDIPDQGLGSLSGKLKEQTTQRIMKLLNGLPGARNIRAAPERQAPGPRGSLQDRNRGDPAIGACA